MKQILILGGTRFIGRNLVKRLIEKSDYEITLFNRGITNSNIFPEIKSMQGDRKVIENLKPILEKSWDIVIDLSGFWAGALEQQLENQKGKIGKYIYISTSSHYKFDPENPKPYDEEREIEDCSEEQKNSEDPYAFYNQNKAECERILDRQLHLDYLILRPSLVIGNYDYSDRLYYWLYKVKHQDKILVGNDGKNLISYTNLHDLVDLIMYSIEHTTTNYKIFNASSFNSSIRNIIEIAGNILDRKPELVSGDTNFLEENEIHQWTGLPLWLDDDYFRVDNSRAKAAFNYQFSDVNQTVKQLMDFYENERKWSAPKVFPQSAISSDKEQEMITKIERANNK